MERENKRGKGESKEKVRGKAEEKEAGVKRRWMERSELCMGLGGPDGAGDLDGAGVREILEGKWVGATLT